MFPITFIGCRYVLPTSALYSAKQRCDNSTTSPSQRALVRIVKKFVFLFVLLVPGAAKFLSLLPRSPRRLTLAVGRAKLITITPVLLWSKEAEARCLS